MPRGARVLGDKQGPATRPHAGVQAQGARTRGAKPGRPEWVSEPGRHGPGKFKAMALSETEG